MKSKAGKIATKLNWINASKEGIVKTCLYTGNTISASKLCFWSCCWDKNKKNWFHIAHDFCEKDTSVLTTGGVHTVQQQQQQNQKCYCMVIKNFDKKHCP